MMNDSKLETRRLRITLRSPEQVRADIDALDDEIKQQMSAEWLHQIAIATSSNPWLHGFTLTELATETTIGTAGFKAPPDDEGMVELAYHIHSGNERQGFATEAAAALVEFAFADPSVKLVRAHTLAEPNASTRILTKCGFEFLGEVYDPEDGLIWRWEKLKKPVIKTCAECESSFFGDSSDMDALCPECAHLIYGYDPCVHTFVEGRCSRCHWDGTTTEYCRQLKEAK